MTATRSASVGVPAYSQTYPRTAQSSGPARRLVSTALHTWALDAILDDASLIVAELVANAVQHGSGHSLRVSIKRVAAPRVRIAVTDKSLQLPVIRRPRADDPSGRGILLVDSLSVHWGTDTRCWGKVVWSELLMSGEHS
ncbi:ATP-binding protein [Streptomyces sp. NPDC050161]|uniref:ATP-binding protein n=1 Tax=Streptomyces sp. NPDC050161 TaxID=3365604 RepID=UPI0037B28230